MGWHGESALSAQSVWGEAAARVGLRTRGRRIRGTWRRRGYEKSHRRRQNLSVTWRRHTRTSAVCVCVCVRACVGPPEGVIEGARI